MCPGTAMIHIDFKDSFIPIIGCRLSKLHVHFKTSSVEHVYLPAVSILTDDHEITYFY